MVSSLGQLPPQGQEPLADLVLWRGERKFINFWSGLHNFSPTREQTPHLATRPLQKCLEDRGRVHSLSVLVRMAAEVVVALVALVDCLADCLGNNKYQNSDCAIEVSSIVLFFSYV